MDKKKRDDREQSERFVKKAKEVADENAEGMFERALKKIIPPAGRRSENTHGKSKS